MVAGGLLPPPAGLALDEALVRCTPERPQLAIWRTRPAVIIGRFQRPDWEVEPEACRAAGARIWRRFSGGGAVYLPEIAESAEKSFLGEIGADFRDAYEEE